MSVGGYGSELEKGVQDVKLLLESLRLQEGDSSQQQQALRALSEILYQNSKQALLVLLKQCIPFSFYRDIFSSRFFRSVV